MLAVVIDGRLVAHTVIWCYLEEVEIVKVKVVPADFYSQPVFETSGLSVVECVSLCLEHITSLYEHPKKKIRMLFCR